MSATHAPIPLFRLLLCGALVVTLSMGVRHGFGLWLQPITQAQNWSRETFAMGMAVQNLTWGLAGIFSGMLADRFGASRVLIGCGLLYALGLVGMSYADTPTTFALTCGVLIGMAAEAGSFGQFLMVPVEGWLILNLGWQQALAVLGAACLLILPLAIGLREPHMGRSQVVREQSIAQAVKEAFGYRSFQWLMAGYFVCGFQLVFIGVHMPSYLKDRGLSPEVASYALALIGLFNVVGTYGAGALGQRLPKPRILSAIYLLRALSIALFVLAPLSPASVYVFSAAMGMLWLSTVPPTSAVIAQIFGVAHLSMLAGFTFFSHQLGSFLGVWLGGLLYDRTGSYEGVWWCCVALGVFAALANLPVRETPIARQPVAA